MIIRSLLLLLPMGLWAWYIIQPGRNSREITATFLGFVWAFFSTLMLSSMLVVLGALHFSVNDSLFYGVPLEWVFAQATMVGALVPLFRVLAWGVGGRVLVQFFLITLLTVANLVDYTPHQLVLIILGMGVLVAIPALLLSDWTALDTNIGKRSFLQSLTWTALLLWFFPSVIFQLSGSDWSGLLEKDVITMGLNCIPLVLPAYFLISALYEFATKGGGTAFPYDPPKRLVTTGVYKIISNPMQVGITLSMGWWGVVIQSLWVSISAIIAVILFVVFKDVCNGSCAIGQNNREWLRYQQTVPKWLPRLRWKNFLGIKQTR